MKLKGGRNFEPTVSWWRIMRSKSFARIISQFGGTATRLAIICLRLAIISVSLCALHSSQVRAQQAGGDQSRLPQRYTREGVAVEFTVEPLARGKDSDLMEGTEATVRLKITDDRAGKALSNLR